MCEIELFTRTLSCPANSQTPHSLHGGELKINLICFSKGRKIALKKKLIDFSCFWSEQVWEFLKAEFLVTEILSYFCLDYISGLKIRFVNSWVPDFNQGLNLIFSLKFAKIKSYGKDRWITRKIGVLLKVPNRVPAINNRGIWQRTRWIFPYYKKNKPKKTFCRNIELIKTKLWKNGK